MHRIGRRQVFLAACCSTALAPALKVPGAQAQVVTLASLFSTLMTRVAAPIIVSTVTKLIDEYWIRPHFAQAALDANEEMRESDFTDRSESTVYSTAGVWSDQNATGTYLMMNQDGLDACAPFIENGHAETLIEGPGLTGLSWAAEDLDLTGPRARSLLIPRRSRQRAYGSYELGYDRPEQFYTERGRVELDYQNIAHSGNEGWGVMRVRVDDDALGQTLLNDEYNIRYVA